MNVSLDPDVLARLSPPDQPPTALLNDRDDDLAAAARRTAVTRRLFYTAVLVVSLYGTASGVVTAFALPWWISIGGTCALELGGVTFLSHADVRRRVGEHAAAPRLLGAAIAGAAATFNIVTHTDRLLGGFFAVMSVLGFVSWWLDVETSRRDRLRARGQLPVPAPTYQLWSHWVRHPITTARARDLAKIHPELGLYGSLDAAVTVQRRERRDAALAAALRRRIRGSVGSRMAKIAVLTYDMDEVANRLRRTADYDGLTALLAGELTAERILQGRDGRTATAGHAWSTGSCQRTRTTPADDRPGAAAAGLGCPTSGPSAADEADVAGGTSADLGLDRRVRITILGAPAINDADGRPVAGVRAKSLELLVFLAVHRTGASTSDIRDAVWPGVPEHRAIQRLSTCLGNLRGCIRGAVDTGDSDLPDAGRVRPDPIVNTGGRYHLDPALVTVDWWDLLDRQPSDSATATENAVQLSHAVIANGQEYPWLDAAVSHRVTDEDAAAHLRVVPR
jgi:hypothetical protein